MKGIKTEHQIHLEIGRFPYRMALAGGWIDQPFMSRLNPDPPGSMVVVGLQATIRFMDRAGMASSTRRIARRIWGDEIPTGKPQDLVRQLYWIENEGKAQPSGSQDMVGLIYPGVNRLDYDYGFDGGVFPVHVESNNDPSVAKWVEDVVYMLPVGPRPDGYNPIGEKCLEPEWVQRLGKTGKDCFEAIIHKDLHGLGQSFNECMVCWEHLLPQTVRHPAIQIDLAGLLHKYQSQYAGAMYSGCGGGYLIVVSDHEVPDGIKVKVRHEAEGG